MQSNNQKYAEVHRDIAAGMMAGDLLSSGYFGKNIEMCGVICQKNNEQVFLYGKDLVAVNKAAYDYMADGAQIKQILSHNFHLKMDETEDDLGQRLIEDIQEKFNLKFDQTVEIENDEGLGYWAGFAYEEDGVRKEFINGYFPRVLEEYILKKQAKVTPIVFQKKENLFVKPQEMRSLIEEKLQNTAI